uniref:Uncharacterized protein n=1 Tax=Arundo donax TaxID=35708 RepID=A0A0A9G6Q5_ARUDO
MEVAAATAECGSTAPAETGATWRRVLRTTAG